MSVVTSVARQAIRDKFAAEIKTVEAKLETLKAEAETAKADIEIKAAFQRRADLSAKRGGG